MSRPRARIIAEAYYTVVVPANAGTHNHRRSLLRKVSTSIAQPKGRSVWVPAFAGTTREGVATLPYPLFLNPAEMPLMVS